MKNSGEPEIEAGNKPAGGLRQKIFNLVGWIAFGLLVPPILAMAGYPQLQVYISGSLGAWGSPIALIAIFYAILFLRVFFGSDQRYTPVQIGRAHV